MNFNTDENKVTSTKLKTDPINQDSASSKSRKQKVVKTKKEPAKKFKESTMSLDSLEDCSLKSDREQTSQSSGINTKLLCPCVPCVIHDTSPKTKVKKKTSSKTNKTQKDITDVFENSITEASSSVELLYKNLTMVSSCDITKDLREENASDYNLQNINLTENSSHNYNSAKDLPADQAIESNYFENNKLNTSMKYMDISSKNKELTHVENYDLSGEIFEENYERNLSEDSFECENKNNEVEDSENKEDDSEINLISRHGSGDTYTKFTDNPADLEEFLTLTDDMMCAKKCQKELSDKDIEDLHTPKTNSIESICIKNNENIPTKYNFSDTIEELKNNFKDLLQEAQDLPNSEEIRKVSDLEHITVYELKFYDENFIHGQIEQDLNLKLPSITENNKMPQKGKNKIANIFKENRKIKMQKRTDKDYQTYIIKQRRDESSDEAPPFKLPRIELKRFHSVNY